ERAMAAPSPGLGNGDHYRPVERRHSVPGGEVSACRETSGTVDRLARPYCPLSAAAISGIRHRCSIGGKPERDPHESSRVPARRWRANQQRHANSPAKNLFHGDPLSSLADSPEAAPTAWVLVSPDRAGAIGPGSQEPRVTRNDVG